MLADDAVGHIDSAAEHLFNLQLLQNSLEVAPWARESFERAGRAHCRVPDEQIHYSEGDPRSDFSKGVNVELSLFFHSEAQLIAEAAKKGISLEGASMYATTFPCPPCAKLIA